MNAKVIVSCLLVGLLAYALAGGAGQNSRAQKWEYKVLELTSPNKNSLELDKYTEDRYQAFLIGQKAEKVEAAINNLGAQGWEMVPVTHDAHIEGDPFEYRYRLFFRRPR